MLTEQISENYELSTVKFKNGESIGDRKGSPFHSLPLHRPQDLQAQALAAADAVQEAADLPKQELVGEPRWDARGGG